jgi:uncharacterized protein (TIGR02186 family)
MLSIYNLSSSLRGALLRGNPSFFKKDVLLRLWLVMTKIKLHFSYLIFLLCFLANTDSSARPVIADLSLRQIEIDTSFKGTEILLFGARNEAGDIVVVVRGPKMSYILRKKEKIAGIWVNQKHAVFEKASGYYNASASRPVQEIKNDSLIKALGIGMQNLDLPEKVDKNIDMEEFRKAFLQKQVKADLYDPVIGEVQFIGDTLFRTIIQFPENIPQGIYNAEVYLFSDGQLSGLQTTPLIVKKKGFDAIVYNFSHEQPLMYGIIAVILALTAGWIAGELFRKV